ncbi:conjugal transfer entry exclusion protein TraS, partial [Escherichia coli]
RQIAAAQQEMAREASNRAESALHGFSSSIASAWNTLSQFGSNRGSSDSVTGGADSTMSAQDSMMASRMRSAVESYAKAHNISNEQATRELASRSTTASAGLYGDAHAGLDAKPSLFGVRVDVGAKVGGRASIDGSDLDSHEASSGSRASHDIDARASKDFKEASDYFTSRKVSESGSHTDNNADSRVDQLSAALNSAKQSYDQYTTNMTRSHEYAEMASRTESMSGQMSEDLSQQFAQYVMKHAPQDAEAILTNTSSPEIAERRRAMAWSFVQEQVQPGVDNAWRESRGDIGKGMESVPSGGGSQDIIADHQGHQAIIEQRTQDSNIRNDVKHQVDNMVTEYRGNIGDTQSSIHGEENIVGRQYSELQNHHKTEALSQNNKYDEERESQKIIPEPSGDNIPPLLQVIKPGGYVFLWVLLWPTFLRLLADKVDIRDAGFDICFSGVMGFILFVAITNGMMLYLAIPEKFRDESKVISFMYDKNKNYILSFLIAFSMVSFAHTLLYEFLLIALFIIFFFIYAIDINRYNLSAIASVIGLFKKESVS